MAESSTSRISNILMLSCMVTSVHAFESLSSHNNNNHAVCRHLTDTRCCTSSSLLYMTTTDPSDNHHDREIVDNIIRNSDFSGSDFDFVPVHHDNLEDDFSSLFDRGFFEGSFPLLQGQADMLAFESFEEYNNESFEYVEAKLRDSCGEECNECDIPKGWHTSSADGINVMEFLGVKRVKPLTSISNVVLR